MPLVVDKSELVVLVFLARWISQAYIFMFAYILDDIKSNYCGSFHLHVLGVRGCKKTSSEGTFSA